MPKNNKKKKNRRNRKGPTEKRELMEIDLDGQVFGFLIRVLGSRFFVVNCLDGKSRRCRVRNRRMKVKVGDCCIISLRDFDEKSGDIIYKYDPEEVRFMQREGILPEDSEIGDMGLRTCVGEEENDDVGFDFEDI